MEGIFRAQGLFGGDRIGSGFLGFLCRDKINQKTRANGRDFSCVRFFGGLVWKWVLFVFFFYCGGFVRHGWWLCAWVFFSFVGWEEKGGCGRFVFAHTHTYKYFSETNVWNYNQI